MHSKYSLNICWKSKGPGHGDLLPAGTQGRRMEIFHFQFIHVGPASGFVQRTSSSSLPCIGRAVFAPDSAPAWDPKPLRCVSSSEDSLDLTVSVLAHHFGCGFHLVLAPGSVLFLLLHLTIYFIIIFLMKKLNVLLLNCLISLKAAASLYNNNTSSPGWCGSVDWAAACELKGHRFDSQSGHMPGLWARSPVGDARESTTHWCFCPSPSPSFSLSKNNK